MGIKRQVSDRAVVRDLERVYGVDINALKKRIALATDDGRKKGARSVVSKGARYSLSANGRVTSVMGINKLMTNRGLRWKARRK